MKTQPKWNEEDNTYSLETLNDDGSITVEPITKEDYYKLQQW